MSLRHALLGLLTDRPHTGWSLLKDFEGSLAYAWPARHSQIYPELARLLEAGLIEQTGSGARGAKTYAITPAGADEVRRWLRAPNRERGGRSDALLRVFFLWLLEPNEAAGHLRRERDRLRVLLAELEAIAVGPREDTRKEHSYRLALEWGLRETRARLEWAEWAESEVASPAWRDTLDG